MKQASALAATRARSRRGLPILLCILVAAGAIAGVAAARAEVYRCERDGHVTFTDRACAGGAPPLHLAPPVVLPAGPEVDLAGEHDGRVQRGRERRARQEAEQQAFWKGQRERDARIAAGRISRNVVAGMSPLDVRNILGPPDRVSAGTEGERWQYESGGRTVVFEQGVVRGSEAGGRTGGKRSRGGRRR